MGGKWCIILGFGAEERGGTAVGVSSSLGSGMVYDMGLAVAEVGVCSSSGWWSVVECFVHKYFLCHCDFLTEENSFHPDGRRWVGSLLWVGEGSAGWSFCLSLLESVSV